MQGFVDRCSGWGQYLASVIVGKVAFQVMYATPETRHVDATIILEGAHIMALTAPVTLFRTEIWPAEDLSALISAIEALIPAERVRAVRLAARGWLATAEHPLDSATAKVLENADTDAGTFLRARALAQEVFWRPADAGGIGGVFEDLRTARIPLWDLPARGDGAAATTFWTDSSLDQEHWSGVPFLRTSEGGSAYRRDDGGRLLPGLQKGAAPSPHPDPLGAGEVHGVSDAGAGHRLLRQWQEAWHSLPRLGCGGGDQPRAAVAPGGLHEWSGTACACLQRRLPVMSRASVPLSSVASPGSPELQVRNQSRD